MNRILSSDLGQRAIFCFLMLWAAAFPAAPAQAQDYLKKENSIWVFGQRTGLDFSSGAPVGIASSIRTNEAAASVSDPQGNLCFYTDGTTIWDRNGNAMPNGTVLTGMRLTEPPTSSSAYGALIVPIPGNPFQYYVFSVTKVELSFEDPKKYGRVYYSIVDMRLNSGQGDVITKANLLDTNYQENIAGVAGDGCYNWMIGHDQDSALFKSWRITPRGLDPQPVLSHTGPVPDKKMNYHGIILPSPDRKKLAITNNGRLGDAQAYDFDPSTGVVGNVVLSTWGALAVAAFSPNSQVLYMGEVQYDLSVSPPVPLLLSISGDMKLAPDGKIYFFTGSPPMGYGAIHAPDIPGPNCLLQVAPIIAPFKGNARGHQFSNTVPIIETDTLTSYQKICSTDSALLVAKDTAGLHYYWLDSLEGSSRVVHQTGTYVLWYFLESACAYVYDTFEFQQYQIPDLGPDTTLCAGERIVLEADIPGASFRWQDNSNAGSRVVETPGLYIIEADLNGCLSYDSVNIAFADLSQDLGDDRMLCSGDPVNILLKAQGPEEALFLWQDGSTGTTLSAGDSGTYWVDVRLAACRGGDTVRIGAEVCDCAVYLPNVFTPNGDGKNDIFKPLIDAGCPVTEYRLDIFNRWGALVYSTTRVSEGWDGMDKGAMADVGTYMYRLRLLAGSRSIEKNFKGDLLLIR